MYTQSIRNNLNLDRTVLSGSFSFKAHIVFSLHSFPLLINIKYIPARFLSF